MKTRFLLLACAATAVTLAPAPAAAQDLAADTAGMQAALRRTGACPGGAVLVAADGERVQGRCDGVIDARLRVWADGAIRGVPLAAVDSVWVRKRGFGTGAQIGAIGGGLAGTLWGYLAFSTLCDDAAGCGGDILVGTVGSGALGSLLGLFVGGSLGGTVRRWTRIHPR